MHETLTKAVAGFAGSEPLRERVAVLLGALGYRSTRSIDAGSVKKYVSMLKSKKPLTRAQCSVFDSWQTVDVVFQFTEDEFITEKSLLDAQSYDAQRIKSFVFLAIKLAKGNYSRRYLVDATRVVNCCHPMPVIVLFEHGSTFTLSIVHRRPNKLDDNLDVLEKVTLIKDIRVIDTHRAHLNILSSLTLQSLVNSGVDGFDALHKRWEHELSVELLNQRFYKDLYQWFRWAVSECQFPEDGAGSGNAERHTIRLITRLLFIWFLREKGVIPNELFTEQFAYRFLKKHGPNQTDYYCAVLQNLFFATLNTEIDMRTFADLPSTYDHSCNGYRYRNLLKNPDSFVNMLRSVPFVNGGLFECLDNPTRPIPRIDSFIDDTKWKEYLHVPADLFFNSRKGLFSIFNRYKFTIEENTPFDQDAALDPNLLGRVFENLLATYNPETGDSARKATGSYYTPRDVVDCMVDEVLVVALDKDSRPPSFSAKEWRNQLRHLLSYNKVFDSDCLNSSVKRILVEKISRLRVLDPACGSGAFPMGVLHKLTFALQRLDPDNKHWEDFQRKRITAGEPITYSVDDQEDQKKELINIRKTFETYRASDFGRKLYLIKNCIFGVDIQPIACQIAKLRFFISLIVEQQTTSNPEQNYGIQPLPNLETCFVAADSLVGLESKKYDAVLRRGNPQVRALETCLQELRGRYFSAYGRETKCRLREQDNMLRIKLEHELEGLSFGDDFATALVQWNPYDQNSYADWFDPKGMFGIEGFDVVIGNPPYVKWNFPGSANTHARKKIVKTEYYETLNGRWDRFIPFIERGFKLLRDGGATCMIIPDVFGHVDYARKARDWYLRNSCIESVDFFDHKLFDAGVYSMFYVFSKIKASNHKPIRRLHSRSDVGTDQIKILSTEVQKNLNHHTFSPDPAVKQPILSGICLSNLCYISQGVIPCANQEKTSRVFFLRDVISNQKDALHPKAFVNGECVERWVARKNYWLEWGTERAPELFHRKSFEELFSVKEKLITHKMAGSAPKTCYDANGYTFNESCLGFVLWADLAGVRIGQKSILRRDEFENISKRFSIKYLLGVMNSTIVRDYLNSKRRGNSKYLSRLWQNLPVPDICLDEQQPVVDIVNEIFVLKQNNSESDVSILENKIDQIVKDLYKLNL